MKYVITGGAGHISKPLAIALLNAGHQVTVIGRNPANLQELVAQGAEAAIGSVEDEGFLTTTFTGADAVYTMIPPNYGAADLKAAIETVGHTYAAAIKASGVKYIVNLSSIGAHLPAGTGPITGLYRTEKAFSELAGTNILHLRPAFFYYNLYATLGLAKQAGIIGNNFSVPAGRFPIAHTNDIAAVAIHALQQLSFTGHTVQYVASDEVGTDQIAAAIGKAIGKPELAWVKFPDDQAKAAMLQAGLGISGADNLVEMGQAINAGILDTDYWQHCPVLGKVKLADFAQEFAAAYHAS